MLQFIVPQFIDVEDKIIGPITVRQFIIGVVAGLFIFLAYKFADTALFIIEAIIIAAFYVLAAFVKVNGQKFHLFVLSVLRSLLRSQLRVWSRTNAPAYYVKQEEKTSQEAAVETAQKPRPKSSSISQLSLLVDTGGKYRPEEVLRKKSK